MRLVRVLCLVGVLGSLLGSSSQAQIGPMAVGSVKVTPDNGGPLLVAPSISQTWAQFTVENKFDTQQTFELSCSRTGTATGCAVDLEAVTLAAGASTVVPVEFSTGASTGSGTVTLRADGIAWDTGSYAVSVVTPVAPTVALVNASSDSWHKGGCLTLGAGEAAVQCGDLLVAHGLPAIRTLGQDRAPTLVYSSRQAVPQYVVAATVTQPAGKPLPSQVVVTLLRGTEELASNTYMGSSWPTPGSSRQVVVAVVDTAAATGVYPFTLRVRNLHGADVHDATTAVTAVVVNRRTSAFGRGWWLAGLEQLVLAQPTGGGTGILWVGADGSADLYSLVAANTWVAPQAAFRDTITKSGALYIRKLRHGVEVRYDTTGHHIETRNRVGHATKFTWADSLLTSIRVPPDSVNGTTFSLTYNGSARLTQLTDPTGRALVVTDSSGSVSKVRDPDLRYTYFGYDASGRMTARKGRGGYTTRYEYAKGLRVTKFKVPYGPTGTDTAVTVVNPWDERGLGNGLAADTILRYTEVLGPRVGVADDAKFWVDRWGQPTKVMDALGATTLLSRGDVARPALVTKVTYPNGRVDSTRYNARGNPDTTRLITSGVAGGQLPTRITIFEYADLDALDSPSKVTDALGRFTGYAYGSLGLPETITDPAGHQTTFTYFTSDTLKGQVQTITEQDVETLLETAGSDLADTPVDLTTTFTYDSLGNLRTTKSPTGARTWLQHDAAGRPAYTVDHYGRAQRWKYDSLNQATRYVRYTAKKSHPDGVDPASLCVATRVTCTDWYQAVDASLGDSLVTRFAYGAAGLDSVIDPRGNSRTYLYDARGQLWKDLDEYNRPKEFTYDATGSLIRSLSRLSTVSGERRDTVWTHRDVLGRDTAVIYTKADYGSGQLIPGDTIRTTYDVMGQPTTRWNHDITGKATLRWTYYGDGSVKTQTTVTAGTDSLSYGYDATGARITSARRWGSYMDSTGYAYHATSGRLTSITAYWGAPLNQARTITFTYDALGRRRELAYPNQVNVKFRYGAEGSLRRVVAVNSNSALIPGSDNFNFVRRLREVDAVGQAWSEVIHCTGLSPSTLNVAGLCSPSSTLDSMVNKFDRLNQLVYHDQGAGDTEEYRYDAAGNQVYRKTPTAEHYLLHWQVSNLLRGDSVAGQTPGQVRFYEFNANGDQFYEYTGNFGIIRTLYYDGLGRTAGMEDIGAPDGYGPGRYRCNIYGPSAYVLVPCAGGSENPAWLVYDGANVGSTMQSNRWVFVQGGGVDDPLMGYYRGNGTPTEYYWITDGAGRHLAAGASNGALTSNSQQGQNYLYRGGKWAGTTTAATSYGADRQSSESAPGYAFFRNRMYDQRTGRWTQEDPIGIAGGLNLYQFNGSNPVSFSDPWGLDPCKSSRAWTECIAQGMANWGASRGGLVGGAALNGGSLLNAGAEALGLNFVATAGDKIGSGDVAGGATDLAAFGAGIAIGGAVISKVVSASAGTFLGRQVGSFFGSESSAATAGLRAQLAAHQQKLAQYRANPDAFDNRGILAGASPERRASIIAGRIRRLEGQIQNFKDQINAIDQ